MIDQDWLAAQLGQGDLGLGARCKNPSQKDAHEDSFVDLDGLKGGGDAVIQQLVGQGFGVSGDRVGSDADLIALSDDGCQHKSAQHQQ